VCFSPEKDDVHTALRGVHDVNEHGIVDDSDRNNNDDDDDDDELPCFACCDMMLTLFPPLALGNIIPSLDNTGRRTVEGKTQQ